MYCINWKEQIYTFMLRAYFWSPGWLISFVHKTINHGADRLAFRVGILQVPMHKEPEF